MEPIFLIVGPPAVGKSTTSHALATRFTRSVHIPVDDLREMVVSGLLLPAPEWSDELTQQVSLARASAVQMAVNYRNAGFTVVIDDFWDEDHLEDYQALFSYPHTHKIVLFPDQEVAHQRNLQRAGEDPARGYIDEGIRIVYERLLEVAPRLSKEGWVVVDSSSMEVENAVDSILERTGYKESRMH